MFTPSPLPRNLEASFRDVASDKAATRASALRDMVRHALRSAETRTRAIKTIEKLLRTDDSAPVRAAAATALADVKAHEALPSLQVAAEDDDAQVRQMALSALGEIGDPRAAQRLERALRDGRPEVRYQAVIAFARVCADPQSVNQALVAALDDGDSAIRYIAMRVAEERLAAEPDLPRDPRLADRARELVEDDDEGVAVVAALYLARIADATGLQIVLDVVAERRPAPDLEDEQACVEMAGELGMQDAIPHLERRVWGRRRVLRSVFAWGAGDTASCAWHARIALARLGHERARADILADLASWRRDTREAAVVAAGRARVDEARDTLQNLGGSVDAALVREALVRLAVG